MITPGMRQAVKDRLPKLDAEFDAARQRGDSDAMAKCVDEELRLSIATSEGSVRAGYLAARARLLMARLYPDSPVTVPSAGVRSMQKSVAPPPRPDSALGSASTRIDALMRLAAAQQSFAKCLARGDVAGGYAALESELLARMAIERDHARRMDLGRDQATLRATAREVHYLEPDAQGRYRPMAKSAATQMASAKQFDTMYRTLTELLDRVTGAAMRQEVEKLRNEVIRQALAFGCRLKNGTFVPHAS